MKQYPIHEIIKARLAAWRVQHDEAKAIHHYGVRGSLRERYVIQLLRDLIPANCSIISGFICDAFGHVTPQLDLIVAITSRIPTISLVGETTVVPVESAVLTAEIKSRITKKTLGQIQRQREKIEQLIPLLTSDLLQTVNSGKISPALWRDIPSFIIAFNSEVGEKTIHKWATIHSLRHITGIWCIGNFVMIRTGEKTFERYPQKNLKEQIDYDGGLAFIAMFYKLIEQLSSARAANEAHLQYYICRDWLQKLKLENLPKMLQSGYSLDQIAETLDLPIEIVQQAATLQTNDDHSSHSY